SFLRNSSPSSRERRVAASTAFISTLRRPPASSVCNPAMAVPPGLVTPSLSMPGCWPLSMSSLALPSTVCAASCMEARRESPTFTPASASASMMRNRYAGPLPDRPVTASSCDSSRTTVSPTESKMVLAVVRSASVASSPSAIAVAAAAGAHPDLGGGGRLGGDEPLHQRLSHVPHADEAELLVRHHAGSLAAGAAHILGGGIATVARSSRLSARSTESAPPPLINTA